ncbi:MAG: PKD domain-containing protein [Thermoplasmata archaeon]
MPITAPSGYYYETTFFALASGGDGAYTYYWSYPGSGGWVQGQEVFHYEFNHIGTFSVTALIEDSGFSSVEVTLTATVSQAPQPSPPAWSEGVAGFAISLSQAETQWLNGGLLAGATASALVGVLCSEIPGCAPVAGMLTAILYGYDGWINLDDHGSGVYFWWVWPDNGPFVGSNPVPLGF